MNIHQNKNFVFFIIGATVFVVFLFAVFVSGVLAFWLDPEPEQDTRSGTESQLSEVANTSFGIDG